MYPYRHEKKPFVGERSRGNDLKVSGAPEECVKGLLRDYHRESFRKNKRDKRKEDLAQTHRIKPVIANARQRSK